VVTPSDAHTEMNESSKNESSRSPRPGVGSNIILIGISGAGKSAVGLQLSRLLGYGFIDTDALIEAKTKLSAAAIFAEQGEAKFRELEREIVESLSGLRSHVVATGGGTVMDDDNWQQLTDLGAAVWLNTPAEEIARRLLSNEAELVGRPLLADVVSHKDPETKQTLLSERLRALIGNRAQRYREADLTVSDCFSTPNSTAQLIRKALQEARLLNDSLDHKPYDRWQIL